MNWRDVRGFEGLYQVSDTGLVKSFNKNHYGKLMKQVINNRGYAFVVLYKNKSKVVHRLVAESFISEPPTPKHEVNHKNGVKTDNRVENLEWVTSSENTIHAVRNGLITFHKGEKHYNSVLTLKEAVKIRELYSENIKGQKKKHTHEQLAAMFNISKHTVYLILKNKKYTEDIL